MSNAECLKCSGNTFHGEFDGYQFNWYCESCSNPPVKATEYLKKERQDASRIYK